MFIQLGLPTFNTVLLNARARFATQLNALCQDICRPMENGNWIV